MARPLTLGEKPLYWVVKDGIGAALGVAQLGGKHPAAKPWEGEGPGVLEVVEDAAEGTFRAVYTVKFARAVYVLHTFQKKSTKGISTVRRDILLVAQRLREAQTTKNDMGRNNAKQNPRVVPSSGNVFADLGLPGAGERQTKLRLAFSINEILDRRGWSQTEAARRLGLNQPKISALHNFRLEGFSVERLMRLLTVLDRDIEIVIREKPRSRRSGQVVVIAA